MKKLLLSIFVLGSLATQAQNNSDSQENQANSAKIEKVTAQHYKGIQKLKSGTQPFITSSINKPNNPQKKSILMGNYPENKLATAPECDTLLTQWETPTPTVTTYGFGGGWITGIPDPSNSTLPTDTKGIYEGYTTPNPGVAVVGGIRVGLGTLYDLDSNTTFQVVVYDDDGSGAPGTFLGGLGGLNPTTLGVPESGEYIDFWIPLTTTIIPTTSFFHVGVEIFPGDASDTLVVMTSCLGPTGCTVAQGENDASNTIYTTGFDYENLLNVYGADFDVDVIPTFGETAIFGYNMTSYCASASNETPWFLGATGGTFSSAPAGLTINASTGEITFSSSTTGTYTVTYTAPGTCAKTTNTTVTVNLDDASFSYDAGAYCVSTADPTPTITGLAGGTFSAGAGLSINTGTGTIDASASTPGTYTVTYTTSGTCPNTSNVSVTINALDDASFNYGAAAYCVSASDPTPTITGLAGGTFSAGAGLSINAGTGEIDASASTPSTYTVTYTTAGTCQNTSNVSVTINALDDASFAYSPSTFCLTGSDPTPTVTGTAVGTFSGSAGLVINSTTGEIDLTSSGVNTYTVTYTTADVCANTSDVSVNITTAPEATFSYTGTPYCATGVATVTFGTDASGGIFSSTAGLDINTTTGEINLEASTPGTYTVSNDIAASGGCTAVSATTPITIKAQATHTQVLTDCAGFSITINGNTYNTSGTYVDTLAGQADNGCDSILTTDLTVLSALVGTNNTTICADESVTINGTTYNASNPSGTEVFTNVGPNGCDSTVTVSLNVSAAIDITIDNTSTPTLTANQSGATYQWLDCDNGNAPIASATDQSFTPTNNGNYAVEISLGDCVDTSACENISNVGIDEMDGRVVSIYPNPTNDVFTIDLGENSMLINYKITTVDGKILMLGNISGNSKQISLNGESKGVYFLTLEDANSSHIYKIIYK